MPCHTPDICAVFLQCEFCCAEQDLQHLRIVCCKRYIQTVSLQNELDCALLTWYCFENTLHIQYIYTYQCVYSCVRLSAALFYTACHILYTNMALTCHHMDAQWHHYYQLQSSLQSIFLYMHNMIKISFENSHDWEQKYPIFDLLDDKSK